MIVGYYPGCSLKGTARDYAASLEAVCAALDIELQELDDWSCCGATASHSLNHKMAIELAGRNLALAEEAGHEELVVPCPLCFNRLRKAEHSLMGEERHMYRVSISGGKVQVKDLANFLSQEKILRLMETNIKTSLKGITAVCYYGCMANRPPGITGEREFENPMSMDKILERLGAEVVPWSYKTDCCGASHLVARPDIVSRLVGKLYEEASRAGANCIVVSCQMCQANLDLHQEKILKQMGARYRLPILYFTELMGLAMGHRDAAKWLRGHFVDPGKCVPDPGQIVQPMEG